jgi:hypothetical protein
MLLPMESCGSEKAGAFAAAFGHVGLPVGLALAATVAYACLLGDEGPTHFPEGLRLAQLAGVLLLPVALWAYTGEEEGPPFVEMAEAGEKERWPFLAVLKGRACGLVGGTSAVALDSFAKSSIIYYWPILLPHALGHGGLHIYGCLAISLMAMAGCTLLGAAARERLAPRCVIFRLGAVITAGGLWAWFRLVSNKHHKVARMLVGYLIVLGPGLGFMHGSMASLLIEPFATPVAYSGCGMLHQITNALIQIAYPSLAFWLLSLSETSDFTALQLAPGINAIGHVVTSLLLGALATVGVTFLLYHKRSCVTTV